MKITELKKELNAMDKAELVILLCKLYKANRQCQAILDVEICGASAEAPIIESCRKKIHEAFFGRQLSLKNARAVISDFRKASQNKESIADLMLYYVECGVEFTNLYGDIDERFIPAWNPCLPILSCCSTAWRTTRSIAGNRSVFEQSLKTHTISDGDFPMKWQGFILIYVFGVINGSK